MKKNATDTDDRREAENFKRKGVAKVVRGSAMRTLDRCFSGVVYATNMQHEDLHRSASETRKRHAGQGRPAPATVSHYQSPGVTAEPAKHSTKPNATICFRNPSVPTASQKLGEHADCASSVGRPQKPRLQKFACVLVGVRCASMSSETTHHQAPANVHWVSTLYHT